MTQVQAMSNAELNMELALLMGYTKDKRYPGRVTRGNVVTMPKDYCNDPAASMEVQAAACIKNKVKYIQNLAIAIYGDLVDPEEVEDWSCIIIDAVADMLSATPRQMAEAAYVTLKGDLHETG